MNTALSVKWYCLEHADPTGPIPSIRSIYIDRGECLAQPIGATINNGTRPGQLVASSAMGLTIFDLFREIMSEKDLKYFLLSHGITDHFDGNSLALRSMLLLMDLSGILRLDLTEKNAEEDAIEEVVNEDAHAVLMEEDIKQEFISNSDGEASSHTFDSSAISDDISNENLHSTTIGKLFRQCKASRCGCNTVFPTIKDKRDHYIKNGTFPCKRCDYKAWSEKNLRDHRQTEHRVIVETPTRYPCRLSKTGCYDVFQTARDRNEHEEMVKHYQCEPCGLRFHKLTERNAHQKNDVDCKSYICPFCDKVWPLEQRGDRQKMKTHMLSCENPRNFVCDVCGQGYNTKRHLKAHMQLHTEEGQKRREETHAKLLAHGELRRKNPRRFPCTMCDRNYTTNQKLRFHMTSAHGIGEKLECPLCPRKLMTPNNLSGHLKTVHGREKVTNKCFLCHTEHPTKVKAIACEVAHRKAHADGNVEGFLDPNDFSYPAINPETGEIENVQVSGSELGENSALY
ncbi:Oidioi.mRNA.OKI2018_I69.PAR.g10221.t1.cds [Oikopleura dioica]|uniref:Oidioi.mRNA.OKI2018_I69.PAR.g10221.t1.cds n=1 Tax=Oikopleura dioica TaxID=34765 RepID=A0ABN7RSJ9_OIKDI|nr:Oidioi.mRNA.OKI2018_I69.PAR.g10221.t1.cds [Oikopleura dioica]